MRGKRSPLKACIIGKKFRKGLLIIAFLFVPSLLLGENLSVVSNPEGMVIDKSLLDKIMLPVKREKGDTLSETARIIAVEHGLLAKLVDSIIRVESNGDARAISRKGAMGLMQLMPGTADDLGVKDSFQPEDNIHGGVRHLRYLLDLFDGNLPLVLAAYNAGEKAVLAYNGIPPYKETQTYVQRVLRYYQNYRIEPQGLGSIGTGS